MKPQLRLNILPLYRCNQTCSFCIYKNMRESSSTLDLCWLDEALSTISRQYDIVQVDISGGEVSLLSDFYFDMLFQLAKIHCKKIIISTNFVKPSNAMINRADIINVGYNFNSFSNIKQIVFDNIRAAVGSGKIINIKSLDISCQVDQSQIIEQLNNLQIKSWEIIPYHSPQEATIKFKDYDLCENTVRNFLKLSHKMKFAFQNKLQLEGILPIDNYNIKTLYLTPNNKFALQAFNDKNEVYLEEFDNFDKIVKKFGELEHLRDNFCKSCTSKLKCMANRFLNLNYTGPSCSGFKDLLADYKK